MENPRGCGKVAGNVQTIPRSSSPRPAAPPFLAALAALAFLAGCGGPPPPSDDAVRAALQQELRGRLTGFDRGRAELLDVEDLHRTADQNHRESDGAHHRVEGTAEFFSRAGGVTAYDSSGSGGAAHPLGQFDGLVFSFSVDFRRVGDGWTEQTAECHARRTVNGSDRMRELFTAVLAKVNDPKLAYDNRLGDLRYDGKKVDDAPEGVQRSLAQAMIDYATGLKDRAGYQQMLAPVLLMAVPVADGLPPKASEEDKDKDLQRYVDAHPNAPTTPFLRNSLDEGRKNRERQAAAREQQRQFDKEMQAANAARRKTPEGVRSEAQSLVSAALTYFRNQHPGPDGPLNYALLQGTESYLANNVPEGKDGFGRPFLIGPKAADGVRINPDTLAEFANHPPPPDPFAAAGQDYWGNLGQEWTHTPDATIQGALNLASALDSVANTRKLDGDEPVDFAALRGALFDTFPTSLPTRTDGKDGLGRPYEVGPTVADGVHISPDTIKAFHEGGKMGDSRFGQFDPATSNHPPDGFVPVNTRSVDRARLRLDPSLLDQNHYVDRWASLYEPKRFQHDFENEFTWNGLRDKLRAKLRADLPSFPLTMRVVLVPHLDKYDPAAGTFRTVGVEKIDTVAANTGHSYVRMVPGEGQDTDFPNNVRLHLLQPLGFTTLPCPADKAQTMVEHMLAAGNRNREVQCELRVEATGKPVMIKANFQQLLDLPVRVIAVDFRDASRPTNGHDEGRPAPFYTAQVNQ